MRSALGNRFARELAKPSSKAARDMANCRGQEEVANYKRDWAAKRFDQLQAKHNEKIERYDESFIKQGELMSVLRMCCEEGGPEGHEDPETARVVFGIASRCLQMGCPFAQMRPQSKKVQFMHFKT
eukprot:3851237-Pyramimonas_sp.AAC.1